MSNRTRIVTDEDLEKALAAFVKANENIVSQHPDYTKAILLTSHVKAAEEAR